MTGEAPTAEFFTIYEGAPLPAPASDDLMGAMPVRDAQFCLPLKAASGPLAGRSPLLDTVPGVFRAQATLGVVLAAGALAGWLWPSGPTFVVVNFLVGLTAVSILGVQQAFIRHSPPGQVAQINSTMVASAALLQGFGSLLSGAVAALAGPAAAYLLLGLCIAGMAGTALRSAPPVPAPQTA